MRDWGLGVGYPSKPTAATPTASPGAGAVASGTSVTLSTAKSGAEIWYTTNGNLPTLSDVQWFKFIATASTQYIHFNRGTCDYVYVQVYDSIGTEVESLTLNSSTRYVSQTVTVGQKYYIRISSGTFTKSGGTVTGYGDDTVNGNVVERDGTVQSNNGHAAYVNTGSKRRENTAGPSVNLTSSVTGTAGGWEN